MASTTVIPSGIPSQTQTSTEVDSTSINEGSMTSGVTYDTAVDTHENSITSVVANSTALNAHEKEKFLASEKANSTSKVADRGIAVLSALVYLDVKEADSKRNSESSTSTAQEGSRERNDSSAAAATTTAEAKSLRRGRIGSVLRRRQKIPDMREVVRIASTENSELSKETGYGKDGQTEQGRGSGRVREAMSRCKTWWIEDLACGDRTENLRSPRRSSKEKGKAVENIHVTDITTQKESKDEAMLRGTQNDSKTWIEDRVWAPICDLCTGRRGEAEKKRQEDLRLAAEDKLQELPQLPFMIGGIRKLSQRDSGDWSQKTQGLLSGVAIKSFGPPPEEHPAHRRAPQTPQDLIFRATQQLSTREPSRSRRAGESIRSGETSTRIHASSPSPEQLSPAGTLSRIPSPAMGMNPNANSPMIEPLKRTLIAGLRNARDATNNDSAYHSGSTRQPTTPVVAGQAVVNTAKGRQDSAGFAAEEKVAVAAAVTG